MDLKLNKRLIQITSWNTKECEIRAIHIADIGHIGIVLQPSTPCHMGWL
jgi:hypothetical protein